MANYFGVGEDGFSRSNGGSQVLLDTLTLAASSLAHTDWEKACAACLNRCAFFSRSGTGSLDLLNVPWSADPHEAARQRDFLRRAAALALEQHRWGLLRYSPDPDRARESLLAFQALLDSPRLTSGAIQPEWLEFGPTEEVKFCEKHGVYSEVEDGLVFCNLCLEERGQV